MGTDHGRVILFDLSQGMDLPPGRNAGAVCLQAVFRSPFNRIDAVVKVSVVSKGSGCFNINVVYKSGCFQVIRVAASTGRGGAPGRGFIGDFASQFWNALKQTKAEVAAAGEDPRRSGMLLYERPDTKISCSVAAVIDGLNSWSNQPSLYNSASRPVASCWAYGEDLILRDKTGWLYSYKLVPDSVPTPLGLWGDELHPVHYDGIQLIWSTRDQLVCGRILANTIAPKNVQLGPLLQLRKLLHSDPDRIDPESNKQRSPDILMLTRAARQQNEEGLLQGPAIHHQVPKFGPPTPTKHNQWQVIQLGRPDLFVVCYYTDLWYVKLSGVSLTVLCYLQVETTAKSSMTTKSSMTAKDSGSVADCSTPPPPSAVDDQVNARGESPAAESPAAESRGPAAGEPAEPAAAGGLASAGGPGTANTGVEGSCGAVSPLRLYATDRGASFLLGIEEEVWLLDWSQHGCQNRVWYYRLPLQGGGSLQVDSSFPSSDIENVVLVAKKANLCSCLLLNGWSGVLRTSVSHLVQFPPTLIDTYRTTRWLLMCSNREVPLFGRLENLKALAAQVILDVWIQHLESVCNQTLRGDFSATIIQVLEDLELQVAHQQASPTGTDTPVAPARCFIDDPSLMAQIVDDDDECISPSSAATKPHAENALMRRLVAFTAAIVDLIVNTDNAALLPQILSLRLVNRGALVSSAFALSVEHHILKAVSDCPPDTWLHYGTATRSRGTHIAGNTHIGTHMGGGLYDLEDFGGAVADVTSCRKTDSATDLAATDFRSLTASPRLHSLSNLASPPGLAPGLASPVCLDSNHAAGHHAAGQHAARADADVARRLTMFKVERLLEFIPMSLVHSYYLLYTQNLDLEAAGSQEDASVLGLYPHIPASPSFHAEALLPPLSPTNLPEDPAVNWVGTNLAGTSLAATNLAGTTLASTRLAGTNSDQVRNQCKLCKFRTPTRAHSLYMYLRRGTRSMCGKCLHRFNLVMMVLGRNEKFAKIKEACVPPKWSWNLIDPIVKPTIGISDITFWIQQAMNIKDLFVEALFREKEQRYGGEASAMVNAAGGGVAKENAELLIEELVVSRVAGNNNRDQVGTERVARAFGRDGAHLQPDGSTNGRREDDLYDVHGPLDITSPLEHSDPISDKVEPISPQLIISHSINVDDALAHIEYPGEFSSDRQARHSGRRQTLDLLTELDEIPPAGLDTLSATGPSDPGTETEGAIHDRLGTEYRGGNVLEQVDTDQHVYRLDSKPDESRQRVELHSQQNKAKSLKTELVKTDLVKTEFVKTETRTTQKPSYTPSGAAPRGANAFFWLRLIVLEERLGSAWERPLDQDASDRRYYMDDILSGTNSDVLIIPASPLILFAAIERWILSLHTCAAAAHFEDVMSESILLDLINLSPLLVVKCIVLPLVGLNIESYTPLIILQQICNALEKFTNSLTPDSWCEICYVQLIRFSVIIYMIAEGLYVPESDETTGLIQTVLSSKEDLLGYIGRSLEKEGTACYSGHDYRGGRCSGGTRPSEWSAECLEDKSIIEMTAADVINGGFELVFARKLMDQINWPGFPCVCESALLLMLDKMNKEDVDSFLSSESVEACSRLGYRKAAIKIAGILHLYQCAFSFMSPDEVYSYIKERVVSDNADDDDYSLGEDRADGLDEDGEQRRWAEAWNEATKLESNACNLPDEKLSNRISNRLPSPMDSHSGGPYFQSVSRSGGLSGSLSGGLSSEYHLGPPSHPPNNHPPVGAGSPTGGHPTGGQSPGQRSRSRGYEIRNAYWKWCAANHTIVRSNLKHIGLALRLVLDLHYDDRDRLRTMTLCLELLDRFIATNDSELRLIWLGFLWWSTELPEVHEAFSKVCCYVTCRPFLRHDTLTWESGSQPFNSLQVSGSVSYSLSHPSLSHSANNTVSNTDSSVLPDHTHHQASAGDANKLAPRPVPPGPAVPLLGLVQPSQLPGRSAEASEWLPSEQPSPVRHKMSLDDFCVAVHRTICEEVSSISLDEHVEAAGPNQVGGADPPGGADKCLFIWRLCAVNMLKLRLNQLLSSECLKMPSTRPPSTEGTPIILLQDADGPEGAYRAGKAATLESSLSCIHLDRLEGAAGPNIHEHVVTPAALLQMVRIANTHLGVALSHFDAVSLPKGSIHQVLLVLELHRLRGNVVAVANFLAGCVPHLFSHPSIVRPHDIQDSLKDMWPTCWPTPGPAGGPKTVGECTSFIWGVIADIPHGSLVALNVLHQKYGRSDVWFAKMYDAIESIAGTRLRVPFTPESGATALRRAWVDAKIAACRKRLLRVAETTSVPGPWDLNLPSTAPARFATPSDENSRMRTRVHTHDPAAREAVTVFVDSPHIHAGKCNACGESLHLEGAYTAKHLGDLRWLELKRSLAALEIDSNGTTWHRDCHTLEVNWVSHCRNSPHSHNSADS